MGTKVLTTFILELLGIGWGGYSFFRVVNNTKEAILFIMFMIYFGVIIYFKYRFSANRDRKERFEQKQREGLNGKHLTK